MNHELKIYINIIKLNIPRLFFDIRIFIIKYSNVFTLQLLVYIYFQQCNKLYNFILIKIIKFFFFIYLDYLSNSINPNKVELLG